MPKFGKDYSMYSKEGKHVERTQHTQHRELQEGYFESIAGDVVKVHLTTGREMEGILSANTFNRYDVMVENSEGVFLVPKAGIEYVQVIGKRIEEKGT